MFLEADSMMRMWLVPGVRQGELCHPGEDTILTLTLDSCVTLSKLLNFSKPWLPRV